tara:strand:+ start:279 stop:602 length:324 start_codon:yes stop_codon:yes gene_type:complete
MAGHLEEEKKGMRVKKKGMMSMYRGGGMYGNMKDKMEKGGMIGMEIVTMQKGGKNVKKVMIDAPAGHHWMDMGDGKFVLMAHKGEFKPHKGAMLKAPFEIITVHGKK